MPHSRVEITEMTGKIRLNRGTSDVLPSNGGEILPPQAVKRISVRKSVSQETQSSHLQLS